MTTPADQRPLTILIAADTYPPDVNGAAQFGYRLAKGMTARGHDVHVLASRDSKGKSFTEFREEATVHRLRSHRAFTHETFRLCFPWEIKKDISLLFDRVKPDVVHIQSHYMIGEHVLYEAVKRGVRIIATNHFMPENLNPFLPFPQWFKDIIGRVSWKDMGKVMGQADVVTTPTPLAARAMHDHAFLRKVLPLPTASTPQPTNSSRANTSSPMPTPPSCLPDAWRRKSMWTCSSRPSARLLRS